MTSVQQDAAAPEPSALLISVVGPACCATVCCPCMLLSAVGLHEYKYVQLCIPALSMHIGYVYGLTK